jgi:hypothetical protein
LDFFQTGSADRTNSPARSNDKKYPGLEFNGTNRLNKRINKGNHPEDEWESYWDQADDNQIQGNSLEGIDNKTNRRFQFILFTYRKVASTNTRY